MGHEKGRHHDLPRLKRMQKIKSSVRELEDIKSSLSSEQQKVMEDHISEIRAIKLTPSEHKALAEAAEDEDNN